MAPVGVDEQVVTFAGPIDELDLQRLDAPEIRAAIEALLRGATGVGLKVRFRRLEGVAAEASGGGESSQPLADLASSLFGASVILDDPDSR